MAAGKTLRALAILRRTSSNLAVDATVNAFARAIGHKRVIGQFVLASTMSPASGYPRVRFTNDGTNFQVVRPVARDAAASTALGAEVYSFDLPIEGPYVAVELTNGASVAGNASAWAELRPE